MIQGHALLGRVEGATLSGHLRRCLGVHPRRPWHKAAVAGLVGVELWLLDHLVRYHIEEINNG